MTATTAERGLWVREYSPAPDHGLTLVCFPHAGGGASAYRPLATALGPRAGVLSLQYPGRQDRRTEPPYTSVDALADDIAATLLRQVAGPVVLFGHSMGALVAYETARRLERDGGAGPLGLVVSGARSAAEPRPRDVSLRSDAGIIDELRQLDGTSAELLDDPEIQAMILPALRADYTALETYRHRPGPPLRCPVSAYVGDADPQAGALDAERWADLTSGTFRQRTFAGGHFFVDSARQRVAAALAEDLDAFAPDSS
ncbi:MULTISPECIES: alpha/beta fold hydrolase [unclassified Streptomyces]|uniref:thioesterase II family protein n=1 Tax=unclassified Streptomyces TaxID=2593676 RepID=UPI002E8040F5|nr:alpha/beta fold hydrolase [Streptomyces sp. NBC_00589]WTI38555.1 alpha/beta fold hydrolase [Streptomyces sp. NBC_00775]WUB27766.1 alpha/beta fold hydrolase [Streptomyces sp. NBC_00589]